jgi:hypothetical protein
MLVLKVAAAKILAVIVGTSIYQPTCLVSLPALFVPITSALILLKWIFAN